MALRPLFLLPLAALCAATALADDFDAKVGAGLLLVGGHEARDRWGDRGRGDHDRQRDDRRSERERRERWRDIDRPKPPAPVQPSPREYEPREPRNREVPNQPAPVQPGPRRGRWEQGYGVTIHPWRPAHFTSYLGYSFDVQECIEFGRAAGFPFVVRYDYSGDCYGDSRPY